MPPDATLWQMISTLGSFLGVLGMAFAVGYNWRRVTVLEQAFDTHLKQTEKQHEDMNHTYARKDLTELELKAIKSRLDYMSRQLATLLGERRVDDPV